MNSKTNTTLKCLSASIFHKFLLVLLTHFFYTTGLAQISYSIENYTFENGLPNNMVEDIEWDNNNVLWITTFRGVGRFDGKWFQQYTKRNGGLYADHDGPLIKDAKGALFFADTQADIYAIRHNKPVLIDTQSRGLTQLASPRVLQLPESFWPSLFTSKRRLFQQQQSMAPVLLNDESFLFVENKMLMRYNRVSNSFDTLRHYNDEISLFKSGASIFLHQKQKGIFKVETLPGNKLEILPFKMDGYSDAMNIFWMPSMPQAIMVKGSHCYLLTLVNGRLQQKLLCNALPASLAISGIKYNASLDVLAIATAGTGIYIIRKKPLKTYLANTESIVYTPDFYFSSMEMQDKQIILAYNKKLDLNNGVISPQNTVPHFKSGIAMPDGTIFYSDDNNHIFSFDTKTKRYKKRLSFPEMEGTPTFIKSNNRLFYSIKNKLIELNDLADSVFFTAQIESKQLAKGLAELRPGYLVFAGFNGIFGFNINTKKLELLYSAQKNLFSSATVFQDYIFASNNSTGLVMYKDGKTVMAPMDKAKDLRRVHSSYIDNNGYAWFSTDNGVLRTRVQALINYFKDTATYVGYQFYGIKEGLEISELNGRSQHALSVLSNGNLLYPGINGMVELNIAPANTNDSNIPIFIDQILVNDSVLLKEPGVEIKLPKNARDLKIKLLSVQWGIADKIIEYRLLGHSDHWQLLDYKNENHISFQNISSGSYQLQIRELSIFDRTEINTKSLLITIEHPWYRTNWFKFLLLITAVLMVWGISAWRNNYLRRRNKALQNIVETQIKEISEQNKKLETQLEKLEKDYAMKNRLISMIGHDIITPLRFMSSAGNKLLHHKESISQETYDEVIKTMVETGDNLKDMSTNMLNWIKHHSQDMRFKPEEFYLYEAIQQVVNNVTPMSRFKHIHIQNNAAQNLVLYQYVEPFKNILFQLISNAIKYCSDGSIYVNSFVTDAGLQISITDEGPGMTAAQIEQLAGEGRAGQFTSTHENKGHGFGYLIIKDMLAIVQGTLSIKSERDKGTSVTIFMPISVN